MMPSLTIQAILKNRVLLLGLVAAVLAVALWFAYSSFQSKEADRQEKALEVAAQEAAKSENPFRSSNPLSGVKADPLEKTKKVLNPFE